MQNLSSPRTDGEAAPSWQPVDWRGLARHGSFHLIRWAWLLGLYVVIVSYTFATLGAWQFQDQIREIVGDRSSANKVRQQLVLQLRQGLVGEANFASQLGALQAVLGELDQSLSPPMAGPEERQAGAQPVVLENDGTGLDAAIPQPFAPAGMALQVTRVKQELARFGELEAVREGNAVVARYLDAIADQLGGDDVKSQRAVAVLAEYLTADNLRSPVITPLFYLPGLEGVPRQLATWNDGYLTLLLTLLMGALGSLLYVTRSYLAWAFKGLQVTEPAPQPVSWFIFRPLFGAITALAILILVKAGQLTFSSGTTFSLEEGSVNPYIIAFVAIIAGLMSWQCLELIETVGQRWLQSARRADLWATGLEAALQRRGRTIRALADQIGRSPRQIERWLLLKDKVNPELQDRIATWLEATRTELFGDELPQQVPSRSARLAKDLAAALTESGRTAKILARQLGEDPQLVQTWIANGAPVPPEVQDLICDWLDQPIAELFDLPNAASTALPAALAGRTGQSLSETLGISVEVAGRWLTGTEPIPPEWRPRIADWLGLKERDIAWP